MKYFSKIFIIFFVLLSCRTDQIHSNNEIIPDEKPTIKEWTYMFYNDADFTPGYDPLVDLLKKCGQGMM